MPMFPSRPLHTAQEILPKAIDRHNPGPQPRPQEHPARHSRFNPLNRIKRCFAKSREPEPIYAIQPPPRVPDPYERPFEATLRRQAQERDLADHLRRERRKRPAPNTPPQHPSPILRDPPRPRLRFRSNTRPRLPVDPPARHPQFIPPQTDPLRPQSRGNERPRVPIDPPIEPRQSSERKKDPEPDRLYRGASRTKHPPPMPYFHHTRAARARYYLPSPISITDQRYRRAASQGHCEPVTPSTTCAPVYLPSYVAGAPLIPPRQNIARNPPPPHRAAQAPILPPNLPFHLPTSQGLLTWTPYTQAPAPPLPPYEPYVPPRFAAAGDVGPFSPILIWPPPERVQPIQLAPWLSASSLERDLQPSIVWDLAQWPTSAMCRTERDILLGADDVFDLPATHPPVRRMVIRCDHLDYFSAVWPWGPIIVESASGVTVGEIFKAIFKYFQRQLTNAEANLVRSRSDASYGKMAKTWRDRCRFRNPGTIEYERRQGLKRIDCLGKRHMFWGVRISFNHDRQSWGAHLGLTNRR